MIEFGKTLRAARESKGMSIGQLAEKTRLAPTTVQDLESENFSRIAAPIYGRGFVKLYCEAVGLDPKPHIDEFMEIFSGNCETEIRERPLPSREDTIAHESPSEISVSQATKSESDLFDQPSESESPISTVLPNPPLSRYAAPIRQNASGFDFHVTLRLGILAAIALVTLALLFFGLRAIYRATTGDVDREQKADTQTTVEPTTRTPQKIPSLYID